MPVVRGQTPGRVPAPPRRSLPIPPHETQQHAITRMRQEGWSGQQIAGQVRRWNRQNRPSIPTPLNVTPRLVPAPPRSTYAPANITRPTTRDKYVVAAAREMTLGPEALRQPPRVPGRPVSPRGAPYK